MPSDSPSSDTLFQPGTRCRSVVQARRAAVLVDGCAYFEALRSTLLKAKRRIVIVGWDIDSRTDLAPHLHDGDGIAPDGEPTRLKALLERICTRNPEIRIQLLLWDFTLLYANQRETLPMVKLELTTSPQIEARMDDALPFGACHHQKIVAVDGVVAFCGGLDVTLARWDDNDHAPDNPLRRMPNGESYTPFHDAQMVVDGEAARAIAALAEERWAMVGSASGDDPAADGDHDPWPDGVAPDFEDVSLALSLTTPTLPDRPGERQIEALYVAAIERAERLIYIENQFLTTPVIADALAQRLSEVPDLEAVIVAPAVQNTWIETKSMGTGRKLFRAQLDEAGVADRVTLVAPVSRASDDTETSIMVHAKLMVVDEHFLTIGSANLNRRSMHFDTEANLSIQGDTDRERQTIGRLRDRLVGEHLGMTGEDVPEAWAAEGRLGRLIQAHADSYRTSTGGTGPSRALLPIEEPHAFEVDPASHVLLKLADPKEKLRPEVLALLGDDDVPAFRPRVQKFALLGSLAVILLLASLWSFTPLADYTDVARMEAVFAQITGSPWTPVLVALIYVLASLVMFPITVLLILTSVVFDPLAAVVYAIIGTTLGAVTTYGIGAWGGRRLVRRLMGHRLTAISQKVARQGILAVVALRVTPVAPFSLINIVAGATHIRLVDFVIGTMLGLLPSVVLLTLVGEGLWSALSDPTPGRIAILIVGIIGWLAVSFALQRLFDRLVPDDDSDRSSTTRPAGDDEKPA
ncbi:MAG: VTT domain-containing protein [Alphaproteobacteria bacterium]|nr:VTT domain-containing protein [Alphaproteobacteria bacterium]